MKKNIENPTQKGLKDASRNKTSRNSKEKNGKLWTFIKTFAVGVLAGVLIVVLLILVQSKKETVEKTVEEPETVEDHDITLENDGWFGYTAADFGDVILDTVSREKKLIVYEANLSDTILITKTGLANLKAFTKTQDITYHGTATYTVDLSKVTRNDIILDKNDKTLTVKIPHTVAGDISTPASKMECHDVERGFLAFGDLKLSADDYIKAETEATKKMMEKLIEENEGETADRFAVLSVWEIFQPVVSSLSPQCRVVVEFQ